MMIKINKVYGFRTEAASYRNEYGHSAIDTNDTYENISNQIAIIFNDLSEEFIGMFEHPSHIKVVYEYTAKNILYNFNKDFDLKVVVFNNGVPRDIFADVQVKDNRSGVWMRMLEWWNYVARSVPEYNRSFWRAKG